MSEETTKYQKEWDEFRKTDRSGCIVLLLALPFVVLALFLSSAYPQFSYYLNIITIVFIALPMVYLTYSAYKGDRPKCPRCGSYFDNYKPMAVKFCVQCGLPKYYGSSYYYDLWSEAEAGEMAEMVKGDRL